MTPTLNPPLRPATAASFDMDPGPIDPEALAHRIEINLAAHGWAHLARAISDEEFEAVARCLGTIDLRTDLFIDPQRAIQHRRDLGNDAIGRPLLFEPCGMDFHTDRPSADILAWRCVEPDAQAGENQWIDVRDVGSAFSSEELDALGRIEVGYRFEGPAGPEVRYNSLLEPDRDGFKVFYVPWRLRPPQDEAGSRAVERFAAYVRGKVDHALMTRRLERGECLWLENRRMLHGRSPLPPDTKRHLVRLYIQRATRG